MKRLSYDPADREIAKALQDADYAKRSLQKLTRLRIGWRLALAILAVTFIVIAVIAINTIRSGSDVTGISMTTAISPSILFICTVFLIQVASISARLDAGVQMLLIVLHIHDARP